MDKLKTLRRYGLFDAKVPRYTSYPPANRFEAGVGQVCQKLWLNTLDVDQPVSVYIHIPFCRRLCWFCACRTQGTKTLKPVDDYISTVIKELQIIAENTPAGLRMERLHLGGGTPTLLTGEQMRRLLTATLEAFAPTDNLEFSVEVDPTEASDEVIHELTDWKLGRASVGVQDFDPKVQEAIGRPQTLEQTQTVIEKLRGSGVKSLNIDLLYGLPFQTSESLLSTLDKVVSLRPDRLALYGYAHVPHVSKRQVMISSDELPDAETRYMLAQQAGERLASTGYECLGIDHFALPDDSLAKAQAQRSMKRNFQGYTDDPCETLIGLGASAISQFSKGYVQNAVATAAYAERVLDGSLAGHKGYALSPVDQVVAELIESLMCNGLVDFGPMMKSKPNMKAEIAACVDQIERKYADVFSRTGASLTLHEDYMELSRLIAADLDKGLRTDHLHSLAI